MHMSIKIFIKTKTRAVKAYAYRMLVSFKTFVLTSRRTNVSVLKQLLLDITRLFAEHCPMSGANI